MADIVVEVENVDNTIRPSRPTLEQVKALIDFIQEHPDLAHRKLRNGISRQKIKKLWVAFSNIANSINGTFKSTDGWIKYWADKRRSVLIKKKQIDEGKIKGELSPIEQTIYDLCQNVPLTRRRKSIKTEPFNGDDDESLDELYPENEELELTNMDNSRHLPTEVEERQLSIMEKLVEVMDQQAQAMAQVAQASNSNSKALEKLAEASHMQALAVERLAGTFENISSSAHDIRNAIVNIDYTMKQYYTSAATQRQTFSLFG